MTAVYTVKQASQILNISTNSVYKYLKQGSLKSIRHQNKGRFRIPKKSLEDFLGQKISPAKLTSPVTSKSLTKPSLPPSLMLSLLNQPLPPPPQSQKSINSIRFLLIFSLLLIILDIFTTKSFSFLSQLIKIILATIFIILAYQTNNFKKTTK